MDDPASRIPAQLVSALAGFSLGLSAECRALYGYMDRFG